MCGAKRARKVIEVVHRELTNITDTLRARGLSLDVPTTVDQIQQEANVR